MTSYRTIQQIIPSHATSDGDGVKIRRVHGFDNRAFSPFLMIDELKSDDKKDYVGGFPPHPHRGIETLTYMMQGHFQHRDHMGNVGELRSGGAQWMAAGRGVIHSEMPIMEDGDLHGFQIWINQPARDKMKPAQYHDFQPETITELESKGLGLIRLLSGALTVNEQVLSGPLTKTGVPAAVADWRASSGDEIQIGTPEEHNAMVYVYRGEVSIDEKILRTGELALVSKGEAMAIKANENAGLLIFVGEPIDEPVVHYGPFVMNSAEEIQQAINDYNRGEFERY
ncbi:pirin family protein [Vibrio maritimus]|uniref:pirin family protein n=1 Tax=Vibrio maritimus TaxID=990268 RepID=UPI0037368A30